MSYNYMFAFSLQSRAQTQVQSQAHEKAREKAQVQAHVQVQSYEKAQVQRSSESINAANRFSLNRLIHFKSTGGCRSCS